MSEEDKIIDRIMMIDHWKVAGDIYTQDELNAIGELLDLYNKEKEKNKKIENKIKMETNRLKEHGYWEFLEQRDLIKTISIIQNFLEE